MLDLNSDLVTVEIDLRKEVIKWKSCR